MIGLEPENIPYSFAGPKFSPGEIFNSHKKGYIINLKVINHPLKALEELERWNAKLSKLF